MKAMKWMVILLFFFSLTMMHVVGYAADSVVINHVNWDPSSYDLSMFDTVRTKKIVFAHKSCGYNFVSGLETLSSNNPTRYHFNFFSTGTNWYTDTTNLTAGTLYHGDVQQTSTTSNEYPTCKAKWFFDKLNMLQVNGNTYSSDADIAFVKFCFTDLDGSCREDHPDCDLTGYTSPCDVNNVFAVYRSYMEDLQSTYPNCTFVWVTAPLRTECSVNWEKNDALKRHQYNELVRAYVNENGGYLWDIADIESYGSTEDKATCDTTGGIVPLMHPEWSSDGGHFNAAGQVRLAYSMWSLWTAIVSGSSAKEQPQPPKNLRIIEYR